MPKDLSTPDLISNILQSFARLIIALETGRIMTNICFTTYSTRLSYQ